MQRTAVRARAHPDVQIPAHRRRPARWTWTGRGPWPHDRGGDGGAEDRRLELLWRGDPSRPGSGWPEPGAGRRAGREVAPLVARRRERPDLAHGAGAGG